MKVDTNHNRVVKVKRLRPPNPGGGGTRCNWVPGSCLGFAEVRCRQRWLQPDRRLPMRLKIYRPDPPAAGLIPKGHQYVLLSYLELYYAQCARYAEQPTILDIRTRNRI